MYNVYSASCGSPKTGKAYSVRFLLSVEEYDVMLAEGVIPPDTEQVEHIFPLPRDIHEMPAVMQ